MTAIAEMADFVSKLSFDKLPPETREHLKMHILDTIGAMLAGPLTPEGKAIGVFLKELSASGDIAVTGFKRSAALLPAVIASCSATRSTEVDDVHLESCTTPGSVVVPVAVALARAGYLTDPRDFIAAVASGYDMLVRLGVAVNGPVALQQGIWPTYLGATLGAAAVSSRALMLDADHTASALATALSLTSGVSGRPRGAPSSRWLTVGIAAQNGVLAAMSARQGFSGDDALLDRPSGKIYGLKISPKKMTDGLNSRFYIDETGLKPYPVARQSLPAVEAFQKIIADHDVKPESIETLEVWVPKQFMFIINRPRLPESRLESASSVQYQIAVAAFAPDRLSDVIRDRVVPDDRIGTLIKKISVRPSRNLERLYPSTWGARVVLKTARRRYSATVLNPKGDASNRLTWDEVAAKFGRVAGETPAGPAAGNIIDLVGKLDRLSDLSGLLDKIS